ncbi:MAG TPA: TadE/TadG family type IV pilus assembly protein [Actinomycetales bacterium]|nr:TadE/TadG family type IV pilus assembly protein [Actinomycetales bacterium]
MTRLRADEGSAVVEFCLLSVLMLVPLVYLVMVLGRVQAATLAAQSAAREAGRVFVTASDDASGRGRAEAAAAIAFRDHGFDQPGTVSLDLGCDAVACLVPGARVEARTRVAVVLPGVPHLLDRVVPTRIEVEARQVVAVDRFRESGHSAGAEDGHG